MSPRLELQRTGWIPSADRERGVKAPVVKREIIADVPDITGLYPTKIGQAMVNLDDIDPTQEIQRMVLTIEKLGIRDRKIDLSPEGRGGTKIGESLNLIVQLHEPIRVNREWRRRVSAIRRGLPLSALYGSAWREKIESRTVRWERRKG